MTWAVIGSGGRTTDLPSRMLSLALEFKIRAAENSCEGWEVGEGHHSALSSHLSMGTPNCYSMFCGTFPPSR